MAGNTEDLRPHGTGHDGESTRGAPVYAPLTDIFESRDGLVMLLEMPGVRIEDCSVTLDKGVLRITAQAREEAPTGYTLSHAEYRAGDFERAFSLSEAVDEESITASMKNGVLRIALSRAGPPPSRRIAVGQG